MTEDQPNLLRTVFDALYQAASTITGMFGFTPVQVVMFAGFLFGLLLLWQVWGAIRGKTSFTLEDEL